LDVIIRAHARYYEGNTFANGVKVLRELETHFPTSVNDHKRKITNSFLCNSKPKDVEPMLKRYLLEATKQAFNHIQSYPYVIQKEVLEDFVKYVEWLYKLV
jgi:hypothetical protein